MSPGTYESVMVHKNEARPTGMSHVSYECVMLHLDEARDISMSQVAYEQVISRDPSSEYAAHKLHLIESRHRSTSHIWMRHMTSP